MKLFGAGPSGPTLSVVSTTPTPNQTFIMAKPDAVERGLVGEIIARVGNQRAISLALTSAMAISPPSST